MFRLFENLDQSVTLLIFSQRDIEKGPAGISEEARIITLQVNAFQSKARFAQMKVEDDKNKMSNWLWCFNECFTDIIETSCAISAKPNADVRVEQYYRQHFGCCRVPCSNPEKLGFMHVKSAFESFLLMLYLWYIQFKRLHSLLGKYLTERS